MSLQKSFLISFASLMALMLLSVFLFLEAVDNGEKIKNAEITRYQSYLLADELRQSSDDLTRMARIYSITGNPQYKEYFREILAIRNGETPRPLKYHSIYWDFVLATGTSPRVKTEPRSLNSLMREAQFAEAEFTLLKEVESESNRMVSLETRAMNAMEGLYEDDTGNYTRRGEPDPELARSLLHGKEYLRAKEKILKPLEKFFEAIDQRTSGEITIYQEKQQRLNLVLIFALGLSAFLVFISLVLGILSSGKQETDTGRSRLAQRLAASGYPSAAAQGQDTGREGLMKRLAASGYPSAPDEGRETAEEEKSSLLFFLRNLWSDWPFITAAAVVTFMTLGMSWWFLSENRTRSYNNVSNELQSGLDATHDAVLDWLDRTRMEAVVFSGIINQRVTDEILRETANNRGHELHRELKELSITDRQTFQDYILTDLSGNIFSSSRPNLIGGYFAFPEGILERMRTSPDSLAIHFPLRSPWPVWMRTSPDYMVIHSPRRTDEAGELLSGNILFGSLLDKNKGAVFFIVSPRTMLARILRRGYSGDFGEIYLVDAEGRFISENRWKERMIEQGRTAPDATSVVGIRVSRNDRDGAPSDLTLSASRVITGENGRELNEYGNYLGDKVVGAWKWDNTYGFGIINELSGADAFAVFRSYERQSVAGATFTIGLILALTLLFIWTRTRVAVVNEDLKGAYTTIKKQNEQFARDLEIGRKVQMDMLPEAISSDGFALEAFLKPAQTVSGDFYDFSLLDDEKVYFCVGDVSGKGVPAALFMSTTKAVLNKVLDHTDQTKQLMDRVNQELSLNNDNCMFVTLVVGVIDLKTGALLITNAGHNLPYIKKQSGELICLEKIQGPLVGTFQDIKYQQQSIQMARGDTLLFYTDGVTESQNIRNEFYDDERLKKLLEENEFESPKEMVSAVFRSVIRFIGRAEQFDDITILSFQYTGLQGAAPEQ